MSEELTIYPPCKYCGASHGMGVEEMATGKITPMDICHKCLWEPWRIHFDKVEITPWMPLPSIESIKE